MTSHPAPGRPAGRLRALAGTLTALTGLAVLTATVLSGSLGWSWTIALEAFVLSNAVMGLTFGGCGAILAWHRPANAIGWLFLADGLLHAVAAAMPPLTQVLDEAGAPAPVLRLLTTVFVYSWPWAIGGCLPVALLLFPDGRLAGPRWRGVLVAVVVTAPLFVLAMAAAPEPVTDGGPVAYLTLPFYDALQPLWLLAGIRTLLTGGLALVALIVRYRRADDTGRRQLLWLLLAMLTMLVVTLPWNLVAGTPVAVLFSIPLIPVAVTVAIVRHGLLDIRLVVSRALTWGLLTMGTVVAYAVVVAALDRVISARLGGSAAATVILVLIAAPALPRLRRIVDRAVYGDRASPARVVSRLGEQLATPRAGLAGVVGSLRQALRLPYVALEHDRGSLAADGVAPVRVVTQPLRYGGDVTGRLVVGLRDGERRLADADRRVLELLAAPLAVAVHATVVSAELQASRERLVGAREEERRRLRRELHDGLGPTLTGIAFTADAAANLITDPRRAGDLLTALRRDTRAALADVRRVVDDLRPPALDELGLVGALRQRAEQLGRRAGGAAVRVRLDVPPEAPALPAAVEVAAYRIATEALTNVARHSTAGRAVVRLRYGTDLEVSVSDDGTASRPWSPGVGLAAMRERAAELGGGFSAGPSPDGGRVRAWIPLAAR